MANGRKEPDKNANAAAANGRKFWLVDTIYGPHRQGVFSVSTGRLTKDEALALFGERVVALEEEQFDVLRTHLEPDPEPEGNPEQLFMPDGQARDAPRAKAKA